MCNCSTVLTRRRPGWQESILRRRCDARLYSSPMATPALSARRRHLLPRLPPRRRSPAPWRRPESSCGPRTRSPVRARTITTRSHARPYCPCAAARPSDPPSAAHVDQSFAISDHPRPHWSPLPCSRAHRAPTPRPDPPLARSRNRRLSAP